MTENKRIALNTIATYGRSVVGVLCGIFSTRWVLEALGQVDFGLYTVVGGMAIFICFFNIQLGGAISRFYAYSIGRAKNKRDGTEGIAECRSWFTTAIMIHTIVPVLLLMICWPVGIYAMKLGWVSIPPDRLNACEWVWRIVCAVTFVSMISVPFQAMYTAKQYIAELTIYSFLQTVIRTMFIYYMTFYDCDWLVAYALVMGVISVLPQIVICLRACCIFEECKIIPQAFKEFWRIKNVAAYAVWTAVGGIGYIASHQCMGILINNFFGSRAASGFGISQTVSGEAASLTGALQNAFQPAIATAYGSGDLHKMRNMAFFVCKIGTLLTLAFAVPMALEIDHLLLLWLKNPPPYAAPMCLCSLLFIVIEKLSCGHLMAVNATGKIAKFQMTRGILRTLVLPLALLPAFIGLGPVAAMIALPISVIFVDIGDVWLAKSRVDMSPIVWINKIVLPICFCFLLSFFIGWLPKLFFPASLIRIILTTLFTLLSMLPIAWFVLLSRGERYRIKGLLYSCAYRMKCFL